MIKTIHIIIGTYTEHAMYTHSSIIMINILFYRYTRAGLPVSSHWHTGHPLSESLRRTHPRVHLSKSGQVRTVIIYDREYIEFNIMHDK